MGRHAVWHISVLITTPCSLFLHLVFDMYVIPAHYISIRPSVPIFYTCHLQCVTHQHRFEYTKVQNILFLLVHLSCMTLDTIKSTFLRNWNSKYFACLSKIWVILTVKNSSCMSHSCFLQQFWLFAAAVGLSSLLFLFTNACCSPLM